MIKWGLWLSCWLFCAAPLRADTVPPPEQYNQMARETIRQCSQVYVDYGFINNQVDVDNLSLGKVGLTPRNAILLANAITVDQKSTDRPPITASDQWLSFSFYNDKKEVAIVNAKISGQDGNIVLGDLSHYVFHYTLTTQSSKALRDWVLKQPQLAKKFPH